MSPKTGPFSIQNLKFIPGLELNESYFKQVVRPLLKEFDPSLRYSACLIGYGSDVLGFDSPTSMDHNWGPRGQIFIQRDDAARIPEISEFLAGRLPGEFMGFPTNFTEKRGDGTQSMVPAEGKRINSLIEIYDLAQYLDGIFHKELAQLTAYDWLRVPEQKLLELTTGKVFFDGLERLNEVRTSLRYYPRDARLAKLAAYWDCIANEEAFIGRAVEFNDLLGLKMIAPRLVKTLLKICFVVKERYVPYSKWFTRGFDQLGLPEVKKSALEILTENEPVKIENKLADLYLQVLALQNACGGVPIIAAAVTTYYKRPYRVIMAANIVDQLHSAIQDETIRNLEITHVGLDNKIDGLDLTNGNTLELLLKEKHADTAKEN